MANIQTNTRNTYYAVLTLTEKSQNSAANTTTLAYSLTLYNGATSFSGYTIGYRVKLDGKQVAYHDNSGAQTSMGRNDSKLVVSGETTVLHNDDGKKTVAAEVEIWTDSSQYLPVYISGSGSMALTQILRESTVSATDANIGATAMIAVNRRSSAYTHSIKYSFGSLSGYLLADGTTTDTETKITATYIGWTLPDSFYAQIPNAKSGKVTLTCRTYNGNAQLGTDRTATFTATAAEAECAPTVSGAVVDTNDVTVALTGDPSKLVRFESTAACTITAAAKNSAALAEKRIAGETVTGSTREIANVEADSFSFVAVDSRGYSASAVVQRTVIPYIKLTARAEAERVDTASGQVRLTVSGSVFTGSFGAVGNALTVKYRIDHATEWTEIEATAADGAYTAEVMLYDISYNVAHTLEVSAADKLETVTISGQIKRGIPVFDWGESDFAFHVPISIEDNSLADYIIERGETAKTGITWQWAKFKSGCAKCWGVCDEITTNCATAWGGVYTPGNTDKHAGQFDLPFTFTQIDSCVATPVRVVNDFWLSTYLAGNTSKTPAYNPTRGSAASNMKFKVAFEISGKYK